MRPIAIITGGTGGIGFSCAKLLSENNFDLIIVHKDRRSKMHEIEKRFDELRSNGTEVVAFNRITSYNVCYTKLLRRPS